MEKEKVESMARTIASLQGIKYDRLPENGNWWTWLIYGFGAFDASKSAYREKAKNILELIEKKG